MSEAETIHSSRKGHWQTLPTADGSLAGYDTDEVVHIEASLHQNIEILRWKSVGSIVILSEDVNVGTVTHWVSAQAVTANSSRHDSGQDVLILGGADGGILFETVKVKPKMVTVVELDQVLTDGCKNYMAHLYRDLHGVLTEDCIPVLQRCARKGRVCD